MCVWQVRTKDDALITVKQMVFFELRDIETMLNQTADPIADFIKYVLFLINCRAIVQD